MNRIYLRVSKEDLDENTQLPEIFKAFPNLNKNTTVYQERVSAYKEESQKERKEFIKLKEEIESGLVKEVYVYSLERFERNLKRMLEFYFFCEVNGCKLFSALQPYLNNLLPKSADKMLDKNPIYQFLKYLMVLVYGFLAENESFFTSKRTKKSVRKEKGVTMSKDGNKWGSQLRALPSHPKYFELNGNGYAKLDSDDIEALHRYIRRLLKDTSRSKVLEIVKEKKKIILSHTYLFRHFFS